MSLTSFSHFLSLANKDQNQSGRTKLDKERLKLCLSEMVCRLKKGTVQAFLHHYCIVVFVLSGVSL